MPSATRSAGVGWHFVGFVVGVLGLYFGLGVAYNVRRNGAKGLEALPHLDMWRDLPWLVKDGVVFSIDTIKSRGLRRANYDGVL